MSPRTLLSVLLASGLVLAGACGARSGLRLPKDSETSGSEPVGGSAEGGGGSSQGGEAPGGGGSGGDGGQGGMAPECEPGALLVYLVTSENALLSYKPSDNVVKVKGTLDCDAFGSTSPFSMSVDRFGTAFVLYNDGNLYRVTTKNAACEPTGFEVGQLGFTNFGMGFARDPGSDVDELFVSEISFGDPPPHSKGLGHIDTETLELSLVGPYATEITNRMEMTSSNDGFLYGYSLDAQSGGSIVQIDKATAAVLDQTFLPVGNNSSALAFAFWNDDFYIFTSDGGGLTDVNRYRPADGSLTPLPQISGTVVGAGVSTCDPM